MKGYCCTNPELFASLDGNKKGITDEQFQEIRRRTRDTQRQKLYNAENYIHNRGLKFSDVRSMQKYVNRLTTYAWFVRRWGAMTIEVRDGRGRRRAGGFRSRSGKHYITMPTWSRREAIVLHEVGHVITETCYAAHGREYASNLLELVDHMMGHDVWSDLKMSFKRFHVHYRKEADKKRSSSTSSEEMKARMARLRAMRGKKQVENVVVTQQWLDIKMDR